jgi:hypothetical protein
MLLSIPILIHTQDELSAAAARAAAEAQQGGDTASALRVELQTQVRVTNTCTSYKHSYVCGPITSASTAAMCSMQQLTSAHRHSTSQRQIAPQHTAGHSCTPQHTAAHIHTTAHRGLTAHPQLEASRIAREAFARERDEFARERDKFARERGCLEESVTSHRSQLEVVTCALLCCVFFFRLLPLLRCHVAVVCL